MAHQMAAVREKTKSKKTKPDTKVDLLKYPLSKTFGPKLIAVSPLVRTIPTDARKIFKGSQTVSLRTFEEVKARSDIQLLDFDPNFFSRNDVSCRIPGCSEKKSRHADGRAGIIDKEDLFLCRQHHKAMENTISAKCRAKDIHINYNCEVDDYTSYIGQMEALFRDIVLQENQIKDWSKITTRRYLAEVFLNVRNLLIITNAVLNPCEVNLQNVLPPVLTILREVLQRIENREFVQNLTLLLREIMEIIFRSFNIVYNWVVASADPGFLIGGGVGGAGGAMMAGWAFGPVGGMIGLGAVIGLVAGGMIGAGIRKLMTAPPANVYQFNADYQGNLVLGVPPQLD